MTHADSPPRPPRKVVVVGGGAAGLMAAGIAASQGARVTVLEKTGRTGTKLGITGKGRCNLTNSAPLELFLKAYGHQRQFLRQAFMRFFSSDLVAFAESLGIPAELEPGGKYFPTGNRAPEFAEALAEWTVASGAAIDKNSAVSEIVVRDRRIAGVRVGSHKVVPADAVIIATGGLSYPETGSTGDGYSLARALGHTIVPTRPALVPLETKGDIAPRLQGLSLHDVAVRLITQDRPQAALLGDLVFTHYGLSGPVILLVSLDAVDSLSAGKKVEISFDLLPSLDERALESHLLERFSGLGTKQLQNILKELLPSSLVPVCLDLADVSGNITGSQVTTAERRRLRHLLKDFRLTVTGHQGYAEATVTAGGVDLAEVDPRTMQSRLVAGLYFAGEVLDIDGPTGGYNLQAAFSTGRLAGHSAATGGP
ncbi:MAG: NAD(P)/FAD-dependent oxidoreductase [Candidatus Zixiibacteriota bacterium]